MMVVAPSVLGEERVVLRDVSWQLFEHLLDELGATRAVRLAYRVLISIKIHLLT